MNSCFSFKGTMFKFPAPIWCLTTNCKSSFEGIQNPLLTSVGTGICAHDSKTYIQSKTIYIRQNEQIYIFYSYRF